MFNKCFKMIILINLLIMGSFGYAQEVADSEDSRAVNNCKSITEHGNFTAYVKGDIEFGMSKDRQKYGTWYFSKSVLYGAGGMYRSEPMIIGSLTTPRREGETLDRMTLPGDRTVNVSRPQRVGRKYIDGIRDIYTITITEPTRQFTLECKPENCLSYLEGLFYTNCKQTSSF